MSVIVPLHTKRIVPPPASALIRHIVTSIQRCRHKKGTLRFLRQARLNSLTHHALPLSHPLAVDSHCWVLSAPAPPSPKALLTKRFIQKPFFRFPPSGRLSVTTPNVFPRFLIRFVTGVTRFVTPLHSRETYMSCPMLDDEEPEAVNMPSVCPSKKISCAHRCNTSRNPQALLNL